MTTDCMSSDQLSYAERMTSIVDDCQHYILSVRNFCNQKVLMSGHGYSVIQYLLKFTVLHTDKLHESSKSEFMCYVWQFVGGM